MPRTTVPVPQTEDLTQTLEMLAISSLSPHPRNDGAHPPDEIAPLHQSLLRYGMP